MQRSVSRSQNTTLLALSFVMLNVLDIVLTFGILQGGGYELNPIIRATLELGWPATVFLKTGACVLFAWLLYRFRLDRALSLATVMSAGVCLFNGFGLAL